MIERAAPTPLPARRTARSRPRAAWRVHPRHRLDLCAADLGTALLACLLARDGERREREVEATFGPGAVVCASLRSAFELLLDTLALEPGAEVLVSAVTHPDMPRILHRHGLVPVPVDLDPATLAPVPELLERAVTPRTRAILVAHLFGAGADLDAAAAAARRHGLLLLEDRAQLFLGQEDRGDGRADVSLFSFGAIKTAPALGGGVLLARDPELARQARALRAAWPRQPRGDYLRRTLRFAGLHALANPWLYGAFVHAGAATGRDVDALVNGSVRGLRPPAEGDEEAFERWLRRRPAAPLLALLARRLRTFDSDRLRRRAELGDRLAAALPPGLSHPGDGARRRTHWVFPVVAADPQRLVAALARAGFDATRATTSITAVGAPPPPAAVTLMRDVVFVPAYPELGERAVRRLEAALAAAAAEAGP
jgi:perosamine synthetase